MLSLGPSGLRPRRVVGRDREIGAESASEKVCAGAPSLVNAMMQPSRRGAVGVDDTRERESDAALGIVKWAPRLVAYDLVVAFGDRRQGS